MILPKVLDLKKWKEDADQRLSAIQNAQKLHSSQLGKIRDEVADELHSWAKKEIEQISPHVDTLTNFVHATIKNMTLEEETRSRNDDALHEQTRASTEMCTEGDDEVEQEEGPNQKGTNNTATTRVREQKKKEKLVLMLNSSET